MLPDTWRAVELPITPSERSIRARIGAYSLHSQVDGRTITSAARRAATESLNDRLLDQIDPDHVLTDAERKAVGLCTVRALSKTRPEVGAESP